jgi:hypothetical protein
MTAPATVNTDAELLQYSELVLKLRDLHLGQIENRHYRYLYNQSFYGFRGFLDPLLSTRVSERAHKQYRCILQGRPAGSLPTDMREVPWDLQPRFDKGRKMFHLEHIYTGDMFRKAAETIPNAQGLAELVRANYRVAWILKSEDQDLNRYGYRSNRGKSLAEALDTYRASGIALLASNP